VTDDSGQAGALRRSLTCPEFREMEDGARLICSREIRHPGLHYDGVDDVSWKDGAPDD
jgi:hypothetical protein